MTFLNPAILFGLLAAALPVVIHLLNLRRLERIEFSTLQFLKELQKQKIRRLKLKQWLLLLLRTLIILFIVFAFARPTLESVTLGGAASTAKTTAVIIIDDTFSMEAVTADGSLLNRAKAAAGRLLDELEDGDEVSIITVSGERLQSEPVNPQAAHQLLRDVEPQSVSGTLNAAVVKAAEVLGNARNFNKELFLLTDLQEGRLTQGESGPSLGDLLDERVKVYCIPFQKEEMFNLGLTGFSVESAIFETVQPVTTAVSVRNFGTAPAENAIVSVFLNGSRSAQRSIALAPGEERTILIDSELDAVGFVSLTAELEDDDLLRDNARYNNIYVPELISVTIFADGDEARFVQAAMDAADTRGALETRVLPGSRIRSTDLSEVDVVVLIGNQDREDLTRLKSFVNEGGGLILFPATVSGLEEMQLAASALGLRSPAMLRNLPEDTRGVRFGDVDFEHPLFVNIFADDETPEIESPDLYRYFAIEPGASGVPVISLPDNSAFLSEYTSGAGRMFFFAASPSLEHSNFPLKGIFAPLLYKSLLYLSAQDRGETSVIAGEPLTLPLRQFPLGTITIEKPGAPDDIVQIDNAASDYLRYESTRTLGTYRFLEAGELKDLRSVNPEAAESLTGALDQETVEEYFSEAGYPGSLLWLNPDENIIEVLQEARFGSELWKLFLIGALILALAEMLLSRNTKKDMAEVKKMV